MPAGLAEGLLDCGFLGEGGALDFGEGRDAAVGEGERWWWRVGEGDGGPVEGGGGELCEREVIVGLGAVHIALQPDGF